MVFPKQIKKKDPNDAHEEKLTWKKISGETLLNVRIPRET